LPDTNLSLESAPGQCPECGAPLSAHDLLCRACRRLVHAGELKRLAAAAEEANNGADLAAARKAWADALRLLPPETVQFRDVAGRIRELDARISQTAADRTTAARWKGIAVVGPAIVFLLTKGKLLLLGLTNITTLLSMAAFLGVYWTLFGWKFALGIVLSLYVHEMGHIAEIRRFGMASSAPMFIPGLGAIVLLQQRWLNVAQDARIGLAGPVWGLGASAMCWLTWLATHEPVWAAIAAAGAWINLFNLLPVWNLDGGRGFRALTRNQRIVMLAVMLLCWAITRDGLLFFLTIGCGYRLFTKDFPEKADTQVLLAFAGLVISLSLLSLNPAGARFPAR
jgi:Zn-dependent protease